MKYKNQKAAKFIFAVSFIMFPFFYSQASTIVSSNITSNTAWTNNGSPYIISNTIQVANNAKLTINPGVVVQFGDGTEIDVYGSVVAGSSNNLLNILTCSILNIGLCTKTYFTSIEDSTLASNGVNSTSTPNIGSYKGIVFENQSSGAFNGVEMRYANSALSSSNASLSVNNSNFPNDSTSISASGGSLQLNSNSFSNNNQPAMVNYSTQFTHSSNSFSNNTNNGIGLTGDVYGINYSFASGDGPYILLSNPTVSSGKTLTINPGVTIQGSSGGNFITIDGGTLSTAASLGYGTNQNTVFNGVSLQAFNNASVNLTNTEIENIVNGSTALQVWDNSALNANALTINAVSGDAIDAFNSSNLNIKNSTISNFGSSNSGINIFDNASTTIQSTTINTGGYGIVAFNQAAVTAKNITIENCSLGGITSFGDSSYSNNSINLQYSQITNSAFGIYPIDNTTLAVSNNSIEFNGMGAIANPGSSYNLSNNWWGDKSGPYNATSNATGTGNGVSDGIIFQPWLNYNPVTTNSCSNNGHYSGWSISQNLNLINQIGSWALLMQQKYKYIK